MGGAPTPDNNHRVVIEIPGPQPDAKFDRFRKRLHAVADQYGAHVIEEVKTKKKKKPAPAIKYTKK